MYIILYVINFNDIIVQNIIVYVKSLIHLNTTTTTTTTTNNNNNNNITNCVYLINRPY